MREELADVQAVAARHAERQRRPVGAVLWQEPGVWALARHRLAHWLWRQDFRALARWWAGRTRRATGIDVHPAARIGRRCLLLGPGIVVGELAVIGDDATIDAGVMLVSGGITPASLAVRDEEPRPGRGHPSVGNRVRLGVGAVVVGDVFVGDEVVVEAGAVVTRDVADGHVVLSPPCRVVGSGQPRREPDARAVGALARRLASLEEHLQILAFHVRRPGPGGPDARPPAPYGPIPEVEALLEAAGEA
jgi:serine O-acetyltransferase